MERGPLMLSNCASSYSSNSKIFFGLNHHVSINLRPQHKFSASYAAFSNRNGFRNLKQPLKERDIKRELCVSSVGAEPVTVNENESPSLLSSAKDDEEHKLPRFDRNGRFCSPRAARELALLIVYASCLDGMDPVRLFEKRLNAPREPEYVFDKSSLLRYDHMRFGGPPVTTRSIEEAEQLRSQIDAESSIEAEVLSAPLKLVYGKLLLRFTRKLLAATVEKWDEHVLVIDKTAPSNWKAAPAGRILEFSILHLAMSEISVVKTPHQIVINEAVDLAKRFCDGSAPRVINGCLRTFLQDLP